MGFGRKFPLLAILVVFSRFQDFSGKIPGLAIFQGRTGGG
jgi:hypothetical protein